MQAPEEQPAAAPSSSSTSVTGQKKPRRSRGRGLRTTTGCVVCRKRHMKCDEVKPTCGPCAKGNRSCVYGAPETNQTGAGPHSANNQLIDEDEAAVQRRHLHHASFSSSSDALELRQQQQQQWAPDPSSDDAMQLTSPQSSVSGSTGYGSEVAPLRWFGLLAHDITEVNLDLQSLETAGTSLGQGYGLQNEGLSLSRTTSQEAGAGFPSMVSSGTPRARLGSQSEELKLWQASEPVRLQGHEHEMFQRFVLGVSLWIDLFDPLKHFSTFVPHLATRNVGLMKAVLALGARHLSIKPLIGGEADIQRTAAVQYYYETLQYLQSAMRYTTYKNSLELLATVLVVSTYEMIDGAGKGWERHLKGVFWIQRSREINGESGGLEQAIWWAWLRQDVWAAFRERRRCFSFFKPTKPYRVMDMWDVASRITYILAQCINYGSDEEKQQGEANLNARVGRAKVIQEMLDEWQRNASVQFEPLPIETPANQPFKPMWIHPPAFAASLQMFSMARILLLINEPAVGGYMEYQSREKIILDCIDTIGGIALNMTDNSARLMSTQCLFAAGLYCGDHDKRSCIAALIEDHSGHTGWPTNTDLAQELRVEWSKNTPP